ncbi:MULTISPECIES: FadR/GntR family transcriptional regulator [unclassified Rhizobium]|jgi:GntR family transcriptional repressor for pyruvate dehydrogenase complex|uniref:FadR/GntR family transcriptional regulator n=1 Tax=unclassified Rhizobium TaxID=2613769 RepID=UPI000646DD9D|nr:MULTISPECIES: FadR/GntR family transcriptional regulator [unclassified Rhizobium]MBN8954866.1 FadR family transcriptional regulator [Rhizobium tropici]OJY70707.1 MAG: GntR family transcriptional regulator [Rhizobium sp. 60-20]RKD52183.1 GntR family transcriptional regulator [Rhizobium sp. WW_1]
MTTHVRGRQRLAQRVIDELRTQIEAGKLRVGDQLPTEPQLEATFDVSRTVVREAIADLRAAGLVKPVQGKGVFVSDTSARSGLSLTPVEIGSIPETLELLEFRMATEGEAAAIAAYRRTAEQEAAIAAANRKMAMLIEQGLSTVEADYAFHMAIAAATNNRFYVDVLRHFGQRTIPRGQFPTLPEASDRAYLEKVHAEHAEILAGIADQDADRARQAMRAHMMASQRRYRLLADLQPQ